MHARQLSALARVSAALAIVITLVGGVTFAALRSQNNVLSGSRMTSASADLGMSRSSAGPWSNNIPGFEFTDVVPGGDPGPKTGSDLFFRNNGTINLNLHFGVNLTRLTNPNALNLQKVKIVVADATGQTIYATQSVHQLGQLLGAGTPQSANIILPKNSVTQLKIMMQIEDGALSDTSSQAVIDNLDIVFSGVVPTT